MSDVTHKHGSTPRYLASVSIEARLLLPWLLAAGIISLGLTVWQAIIPVLVLCGDRRRYQDTAQGKGRMVLWLQAARADEVCHPMNVSHQT